MMLLQADKIIDSMSDGLKEAVLKSDANDTSVIVFFLGLLFLVGAVIIVAVMYRQMRADRKEIIQIQKDHAEKMEDIITVRNETMERVNESLRSVAAASAGIIATVEGHSQLLKSVQDLIITKLLK